MLAASGSICAYLVDEKRKQAYMMPDPLGGCLCYRYEDREVIAYSSDLRHMVDWLTSIGKSPKTSSHYFAMILSIGNGAYGHSSYEGITVLPGHVYVSISNGKAVEHQYPVNDYLLDRSEPLEHLIDKAVGEIRHNVRAIINHPAPRKIAHLTGGFDTRLVLSAILAEGKQDSFRFMCSGPSGTIDKTTAHGLAVKYGLSMTNSDGLLTRVMAKDADEQSRWGMLYSAGMRPNCKIDDGHDVSDQTIIVSGGYGECARSFYSQKVPADTPPSEVAYTIWNHSLTSSEKGNRITSSGVAQMIAEDTGRYLEQRLKDGWEMPEALDLMYAEQRNRYFVGNIATLFSRKTPRFDPLYSLSSLKAALSVTAEERQFNKVGFEIMRRLQPELMAMKFGGKEFSEATYAEFPSINSVDHPVGTALYDDIAPAQHIADKANKITSKDVEVANRIGGTAWQVARLSDAQSTCKRLLSKDDDLYSVMDQGAVESMLSGPIRNRVKMRQVHLLKSILSYSVD